jgi:hypothetical protein
LPGDAGQVEEPPAISELPLFRASFPQYTQCLPSGTLTCFLLGDAEQVEEPPAISELPLFRASFPQYLQFILHSPLCLMSTDKDLLSREINFPVRSHIKNILYTFVLKSLSPTL